MLLAMGTAYLLMRRMGACITAPIVAVTEIARDVVATRDYSRRAPRVGNDEAAELADSFNAMLTEIEQRTRELEDSNARDRARSGRALARPAGSHAPERAARTARRRTHAAAGAGQRRTGQRHRRRAQREPGQIGLPVLDEPRAAHAAQRDPRLCPDIDLRRPADDRGAEEGIRQPHPEIGTPPAHADQRDPRPGQSRIGHDHAVDGTGGAGRDPGRMPHHDGAAGGRARHPHAVPAAGGRGADGRPHAPETSLAQSPVERDQVQPRRRRRGRRLRAGRPGAPAHLGAGYRHGPASRPGRRPVPALQPARPGSGRPGRHRHRPGGHAPPGRADERRHRRHQQSRRGQRVLRSNWAPRRRCRRRSRASLRSDAAAGASGRGRAAPAAVRRGQSGQPETGGRDRALPAATCA